MKKILYYLFVFITYGADCLAQSANLKAALNQVNQTLKDYAIGTKDIPVPNERKTESFIEEHGIFPTKGEIDSVNAKLPIMVSEGTLNTKVEYNENTKLQTFYYRFTQEVDESLVTKDVINQLKANMVSVLRNDQNNVMRLNAGMTFLYVYYSVDGRRLYDIKIDSKDIN